MLQRYTILALMVGVLLLGFYLRIEDLYRYPAGITDDEAADLVDAHIFRMSGKFSFLIFDSNPRGEISHRLVQGVMAYFGGASPFVIRLTGVFMGMLGIAAAFWASRKTLTLLFPQSPQAWRNYAALLGAGLLVFAMGYLTLSRSPNRTMYQIFFTLLLTGFLAQGLQYWRWRDFAISGLFLGLLLHTYTAAYLIPLAMLPFSLALALRDWRNYKRWLPRLLLTALVATVIIAPILIRLSDAPNYRLRRTMDIQPNSRPSLARISSQLGEVFFIVGSGHPPYNSASAPLIPAVLVPFVILGIPVLFWRIRHPLSLFLIFVFLLILVPLVLGGDIKHGLRISGEYAILPIVAALGAYLLLSLAGRFLPKLRFQQLSPVMIMLLLLVGSWQIRALYRDYWEHPENYKYWDAFNLHLTHSEWYYHADRRDFAEWLISQNRPILIPAEEISEIPTRVWLLDAFPNVVTTERFSDLPDNTEFVMPYTIGFGDIRSASRDYVLLMDNTVYLLPPLTPETHEQLLSLLDGAESLEREGIINFLGYYAPLPADFTLSYESPNTVFPATFNGQAAVINWYGPDTIPANQPTQLSLSIQWTAQNSMWAWYWASVQLEAQDRTFVAREVPDVAGHQHILRWLYPTALWQVGDTVPYRVVLDVPALAAGAYRLTAGLYAIPDRSLAADTDSFGHPTIGWIKVGEASQTTIPASAQVINAVFADSIELSALELLPQDNGQVLLRFYWTSLVQRPAFDAFIFVHLYDDSGNIISQVDARPQDGNYPTLIWDAGEIIMTEYRLDTAGQDLSSLNLRTGAYIFPDGVNLQRLSLSRNGEAVADDLLLLGKLSDWLQE